MDDKELHVHLNGDEAMSFGAAVIATNSSTSFKVRKVYLTQHPKYDIRIKMSPLDPEVAELKKQEAEAAAGLLEDGEESDLIVYEKETTLYKRTDYLGQKKTIHLAYDVNMLVEATAIHPDGSEEELIKFELNDISNVMENEVMQKETTTRPKLSLSFELSRSHLFQLLSAKIAADETVMEEIVPAVLETKEDKKDKKKKDGEEDGDDVEAASDEDTEAFEEEKPAEDEAAEADETNDSEEAAATEEEPEVEKEYKEVIVPHTFNIDDIVETPANTRLLTKDQKKEAKKRIKALDQRDKDKLLFDEAKNAYESQIYSLRDWLRDDENEKYVEESEREALFTKLDDGEEWLYDDGANVAFSKYQERSYELTVEQTKFNKRREEH